MKRLIDLHIHLDGSLPYETVHKLMQQEGMPAKTDAELYSLLSVPEDCRDLNEYLEKFDFPLQLMQSAGNIEQIVYELLTVQSAEGLVYTEIRFAPQFHCQQGLTQAAVVEAAVAGLRRFEQEQYSCTCAETAPELHAGLILCAMRGADNKEANLETVRVAAQYLGKGVVALDLAGAEALFPTRDFEDVFALARELEVPFTIHAGEADGPDSIRTALAFGARRIGHGVRALEDAALVKELAEKQIPLECCPTSNLNTKMFPDMAHYPIRALLEAGVKATVNTDNMTVSDTTESKEFAKLEQAIGLTAAEEKQLLLNAADAIFGGEDEKTRLRKLIAEM